MVWLIYGYKEKNTQKVCYVGQTSNEKYRRYKHEVYDPSHKDVIEYEYPLSRGIRKHGLDYYEYFIIENNITDEQQAIDREQYWIAYYDTYNNGYNQTKGGKAPKYIKFEKETILAAKQMLKDGFPFQKIKEITNISISHLSEINTGKRHHDADEEYPLNKMTCGRKITQEQLQEIISLLKNTKLSQKKIGQMFGLAQTSISQINLGKKYKQESFEYPIRKK